MTLKWLPPTTVVHKTCSFPNFQTRREYTSFAFDLYVYTLSVTYFLPLYRPFFFLLSVFFAVFILSRKHPFFWHWSYILFLLQLTLYCAILFNNFLFGSNIFCVFSLHWHSSGSYWLKILTRIVSLLIGQGKFQLFS